MRGGSQRGSEEGREPGERDTGRGIVGKKTNRDREEISRESDRTQTEDRNAASLVRVEVGLRGVAGRGGRGGGDAPSVSLGSSVRPGGASPARVVTSIRTRAGAFLVERPRMEEEEEALEESARAPLGAAAAAVRALRAQVVMAAILGCVVSIGVVRCGE